jgi:hypothetical protein
VTSKLSMTSMNRRPFEKNQHLYFVSSPNFQLTLVWRPQNMCVYVSYELNCWWGVSLKYKWLNFQSFKCKWLSFYYFWKLSQYCPKFSAIFFRFFGLRSWNIWPKVNFFYLSSMLEYFQYWKFKNSLIKILKFLLKNRV